MDKTQNGNKVKIIAFRRESGYRVYSTYVRVVSNPFEVTLQFSDIKPPTTDEEQEKIKKANEIRTPVDVEIVLPVDVAKAFLAVLGKQISLVEGKKFKK